MEPSICSQSEAQVITWMGILSMCVEEQSCGIEPLLVESVL